MSKKVFILGVNGFIGNNLLKAILSQTDWEIYGIDLVKDRLSEILKNPRFHFLQGDMTIETAWVEQQIKNCDLVLPLAAVATPASYLQDPLHVFELNFEANVAIVRLCVKYKTRLLFPSTSEVYGMCDEPEFNEEASKLILGPIQKERWIYSCSKQLIDRLIYAYGKRHGLQFTIFRPFNWIGSNQDHAFDLKEGNSRVLSQFISNIMHGQNLKLVNGGLQKRSFTYIDDAIEALMLMIENKDGCADNKIFNIGNPSNNLSIKQLASMVLDIAKNHPVFAETAKKCKLIEMDGATYYGQGYQDVLDRIPSIKNAEQFLGWKPTTDIKTALTKTLDWFAENIHLKTIDDQTS